jgi:hypothetical protein
VLELGREGLVLVLAGRVRGGCRGDHEGGGDRGGDDERAIMVIGTATGSSG